MSPPHSTVRTGVSEPWRSRHWLMVGAILVVGLISGWTSRYPDVLTGGDDLSLLFLSQSLQAGHYSDLHLVGTPPHIQYPPLVPAWLLFLRVVFGAGLAVVQAGNLVLVAIAALAAGDAVRRLTTPWLGVGTVALIAWNPSLQSYAGTMLSEIPYTVLTVLAVWALLPRRGGHPSHRWMIVGLACTLAAFLARSVGVGVMAGVVAGLLVRGRWRWALGSAAASLALVAAWFSYTRHTPTPGISVSYASLLSRLGDDELSAGFLDRIIHHLTFYAMRAPAEVLGIPMLGETPVDNILLFLLVGGLGAIGLWATRRSWPEAALVALGTLGILCIWPYAIDRLAVPFVPLAMMLAMIGAHRLGSWRGGWRQSPAALGIAFAVIIASFGLTATIRRAALVADCDREDPYGAASPCTTLVQRDMVLAIRAAATVLPSTSVIATRWGQAVYYFGGFQTVPSGPLRRVIPEHAVGYLRDHGATHVLLQATFPLDARVVAPRLLVSCREVRTVDLGQTFPGTILVQLEGGPSPALDGCPALREFIANAPPD